MAPVESSAAGANPARRSAASTSAIGACETATVGRQQPQLDRFGGRCGGGLRQQSGVLAAHERRRHADSQLSVAPCDIVDQVRQGLRHRCSGVAREQGVELAGGLAGVQCAPHRRLVDPVHHGRARRFHRRDGGQLLGQRHAPTARARPPSGRPAAGSDRSERGSALAIAAITASSLSPASSSRSGPASAPRPTAPTACASVSRSATGSGCSRTDQRGRCHTIAADALAALTPEPGGRPASVFRSSLRSRGAAVENNESDRAA